MQVETATGYLYFANIYGWTGGTAGSVAAGRTNDLLTIILNELDLQDPGPMLLGGDINGDPVCFPALHRVLEAGTCHDVGNATQFTGEAVAQPTCKSKIVGRATRRDDFR